MPRRKTTFAPGEFYHLYNRGANRQKIFFSRENYVYFLRRLRQYFFDEDATRSTPAAQSSRGALAPHIPSHLPDPQGLTDGLLLRCRTGESGRS